MDSDIQAFRYLRRRLARRRFSQLDLRLRLELGLLGLLVTAFVFWQVRAPFAGLAVQGGPGAVLWALLGSWAFLALIAASLVAFRHARRLRSGPPGPPWLALPAAHGEVARHLAWESYLLAGWIAVPALGVFAGTVGLVPWFWLVALAIPLAWVLTWTARLGARAGYELAAWSGGARRRVGLAELLAVGAARAAAKRLRPARWRSRPPWFALMTKDLRVTRRVGTVGRHLATALLFWLLSMLAWRLPALSHARDLAYASAFVLALLGSAAMGEWLVALSGSDPFVTLRNLPVGLRTVWGARFSLALAATALLLVGHEVLARGLSPHALRLFMAWVGAATLAISALAVNYGVTLFPRADIAQRLLGLSLALAVAASLMIPLLGWAVLLSAVLHSARRLAHWSRLEEI